MAFDYSTLITDRTAVDVAYVKQLITKGWDGMSTDERVAFMAGLKGAYNYTDLNRVIAAMKDIVERVSELGDTIDYIEINGGNDFTVCAIISSPIEDYLTDIIAIRDYFGLDYQLPDSMLKMNYTYANNIELILKDANDMI